MFPNVLVPTPIHSYRSFLTESRDTYNTSMFKAKTSGFDVKESPPSQNTFLTTSSTFLVDNLLDRHETDNQKVNKNFGVTSVEDYQVSPDSDNYRRDDIRISPSNSPRDIPDSPADYRLYSGPISPDCDTSDSQSPADYRIRRDGISSPSNLVNKSSEQIPQMLPPSPADIRSPVCQDDNDITGDSSQGKSRLEPEIDPGNEDQFQNGERWTPKGGKIILKIY